MRSSPVLGGIGRRHPRLWWLDTRQGWGTGQVPAGYCRHLTSRRWSAMLNAAARSSYGYKEDSEYQYQLVASRGADALQDTMAASINSRCDPCEPR